MFQRVQDTLAERSVNTRRDRTHFHYLKNIVYCGRCDARGIRAKLIYTDAKGSDAYNDALSLRRAQRIRAELIRLGIDPARIAAEGRGKRELLVPTPDNQAEPRNRRVEVEVR